MTSIFASPCCLTELLTRISLSPFQPLGPVPLLHSFIPTITLGKTLCFYLIAPKQAYSRSHLRRCATIPGWLWLPEPYSFSVTDKQRGETWRVKKPFSSTLPMRYLLELQNRTRCSSATSSIVYSAVESTKKWKSCLQYAYY